MDWSSLIKHIKSGEYNELELVYKEYREEFVKWIIKSFKCSDDDAKEVYQQTIVTFYENIVNDKIRSFNSSIKTYLFAIGKNKLYAISREKHRFQMEEDGVNTISEEMETEEENGQKLQVVEKGLIALGDPCRKILELYYYHKKTMNDIANSLGLKNSETAKNMKYKCLKRLRTITRKECV
jgi:RNA polymerase sigma-70 factor (ECF subfamily)